MAALLRELRRLPAPAKLNLFLHVTGRRADGYHLLETVFDLVEFGDTLDLVLEDSGAIVRETEVPGVAPDDDLVVRAARALATASGSRLGVRIALDKRLPMGGGLGGGSSDAATVLLGLNRLWGLHWPLAQLAEVGLPLGADVPVFVHGQPAYATGIGEALVPLPSPQAWYVIVIPPVAVPTAVAFSAPELTRNTVALTIRGLSQAGGPYSGTNDLQPVVCARFPAVERALRCLREASRGEESSADRARMTGTGACVFAPAASGEAARRIAGRLDPGAGRAVVTRSLHRHPLREWASAPR